MTRTVTLIAAAFAAFGTLSTAHAAVAPASAAAPALGPDWCTTLPRTSADMLASSSEDAPARVRTCRRVAEEV